MYGFVLNTDTEVWEKRLNEEVQKLYGKGRIIQFVKGKRLEWVDRSNGS